MGKKAVWCTTQGGDLPITKPHCTVQNSAILTSTITVYLALSLIYNYTFYCTTMVNSGDGRTNKRRLCGHSLGGISMSCQYKYRAQRNLQVTCSHLRVACLQVITNYLFARKLLASISHMSHLCHTSTSPTNLQLHNSTVYFITCNYWNQDQVDKVKLSNKF